MANQDQAMLVECRACGAESVHITRKFNRERSLDRDVFMEDYEILLNDGLDIERGYVLSIRHGAEIVTVTEVLGHDLFLVDRAQAGTKHTEHVKGDPVNIIGIAAPIITDYPLEPIGGEA